MAIRLVATDIDGTLTLRRGNLLLSLEAITAIRELENSNIHVSLVSGNSLPITVGLARYVGAKGPSIAENGCVIFDAGEIIHVCKGRPGKNIIEALKKLGFRESWQNIYRHHDIAFYPPRDSKMKEIGVRIAIKEGYRVYDSGYAVHVQPLGGGKGVGLRQVIRRMGLNEKEVIAVGDGENDLPLLESAGYSACPADADEAVKRRVDYVASKPGGEGFAEIVSLILLNKLP